MKYLVLIYGLFLGSCTNHNREFIGHAIGCTKGIEDLHWVYFITKDGTYERVETGYTPCEVFNFSTWWKITVNNDGDLVGSTQE